MISFTEVKTKNIDEKALFESIKGYLFDEDPYNENFGYMYSVRDLPVNVQRLIFAKIGSMLIDYAANGEF